MLKHIGRHGDRKVTIIFREIPGEEHMCLVIYPDVLPTPIHDTVMKVLESPAGQEESIFANALHRNLLPDGRVILEALHREGMLKKIPCEQVIVTPNASSSVKLDELNRIVKEMESGEEAAKRMKELDAAAGIVDPQTKRRAEQEFKRKQLEQSQKQAPVSDNQGLDDKTLAEDMMRQASRMETEGQGLLAEAARMKKEAERLFPSVPRGQNKIDTASVKPKSRRTGAKADAVQ
jgi:hypothetical protein